MRKVLLFLLLAFPAAYANEVNNHEAHHDFGVIELTLGNLTFTGAYVEDDADLWHACLLPNNPGPAGRTLLDAETYVTWVITPLGTKPYIPARDYGCVNGENSVDHSTNAELLRLGDITLRSKSAQWNNRVATAQLGPAYWYPHWTAPKSYHILIKPAEDSFVLYMTDKGCFQ